MALGEKDTSRGIRVRFYLIQIEKIIPLFRIYSNPRANPLHNALIYISLPLSNALKIFYTCFFLQQNDDSQYI